MRRIFRGGGGCACPLWLLILFLVLCHRLLVESHIRMILFWCNRDAPVLSGCTVRVAQHNPTINNNSSQDDPDLFLLLLFESEKLCVTEWTPRPALHSSYLVIRGYIYGIR